MTLTELAERIDITLANLSILKTGKARAIRFSTLEAICEALKSQPGDCWSSIPTRMPPTSRGPPEEMLMPGWLHLGFMEIHIASGIAAIVAGFAAVAVRKGGKVHRLAGTGFAIAMLVLGVTASILEPFRTPTPGSPLVGLSVCYLF